MIEATNENNVHHIFHLKDDALFSENEVQELVPLLYNISKKSKKIIDALSSQVKHFKNNSDMAEKMSLKSNREIQKWSEKMKRLGTNPLGLYKVKIPSKDGFYIWEYPSLDIDYYLNHE